MKTVISSTGDNPKAVFDLRFGRAAWFCLYDEESKKVSFFENEFKDAAQGAGSKVVEMLVGMGVTRAISGDFGPKAKDLLERFKVQMVILPDENKTVQDIINQLKQ